MSNTELLDLLREARPCVMNCTHPHTASLLALIDAALAEIKAPAPTKPTEAQQEWVVRMCKAMLMWSEKAHGDYTIGLGTDTQESFTPRQLANRFLKEMGINAAFPDVSTQLTRRRKA